MKSLLIFILAIGTHSLCLGQTPTADSKKAALSLARLAVKIMDDGDPDKAIILLDSAKKMDPENYLYDYEIGFAYDIKQDYKTAAEYFQKTLKYPNANDQCYQMLGNAYDMGGEKEKALAAYADGLKKFPLSGPLHLETGVIYYNEEKYTEAVKWWEKGIAANPVYPSNYFKLASLFAQTDHRIWAIFYGEIFITLERGSKRSGEMSKILFDTYKESITFISDSSAKVDFTTSTLSMLPGKDFKMPFRMVYGMDFLVGLSAKMLAKEGKPDKQISIAYLHAARQTFVEWWFNQKRNKDYPNPLIDFHKELKENNHMEAYNYWLLRMGDEKEFKAWYEANTEKFLAFAEWFKKRGDIVSKEKFFIRPED